MLLTRHVTLVDHEITVNCISPVIDLVELEPMIDGALEVLNRRLANGDISIAQYDELVNKIRAEKPARSKTVLLSNRFTRAQKIFITISVIVLFFMAIPSREMSGLSSSDLAAYRMGEAFATTTVAIIVIALITLRWRAGVYFLFPIAIIGVGITDFVQSNDDRAFATASEAFAVSTTGRKAAFNHVARSQTDVLNRHPDYAKASQYEDFDIKSDKSKLQSERAMYVAGIVDANKFTNNYEEEYKSALNDDNAKFREELSHIEFDQKYVNRIIDGVNKGILNSKGTPKLKELALAVKAFFEAQENQIDVLLKYKDQTQVQQGTLLFPTDAALKEFTEAQENAKQRATELLALGERLNKERDDALKSPPKTQLSR